MKRLISLCFALSTLGAHAYVSTGLGAGARLLDADAEQKNSGALEANLGLGLLGDNWDISVDSDFIISRQKDFAFNYNSNNFVDDFNWFQVKVGPTIKYHIKSANGDSWAPMLGIYYTNVSINNSVDLTEPTTNKKEDFDHELWGYGAKIGVQYRDVLSDSNWLESVNYNLIASHTRYRGMEGSYLNASRITEYDGDEPSGLTDTSIMFNVGLTFGDKTYQNLKSKFKSALD